MSVLIKDMEVPKNCNVCNFHMLRFCCAAEKDLAEKDTRPLIERRPEWCPLVPVPPHYDLIDHNALKIAVMNCDAETRIDFLKHAMDCINKAPVVIPSDMPTYEEEEGE